MRISVSNENGDIVNLNIASDLPLNSLKELLKLEFRITQAFDLLFNGNLVTGSLKDHNVQNDDILLLKVKQIANNAPSGNGMQQAELVRQQILHDPALRQQVIQRNPLMSGALNDPVQFQRIFSEMQRHLAQNPPQQQFDEFDPEGQRRIEEEIRQRNIAVNMEAAMEHHPESFARVIMLYIKVCQWAKSKSNLKCEVNGVPVKAFVDSGAQATIMVTSLC